MKILYLSCHSILEYDELKIFEELGHDYFSIGAYINPKKPHDDKRPPLNGEFHEHLASVTMVHGQRNLHPEQIEWADVIMIMHVPEWVELNWEAMKHKRVIWRSIGQSTPDTERRLAKFVPEGLQIVRYSPKEANIPDFAGEAAMIRFYKDPDEFGGYTGEEKQAITFCQSMQSRGSFCNFEVWSQIAAQVPELALYGPNNDDTMQSKGLLSYEDQIKKFGSARAYLYTGTHPASYTLNFMEAWMSGMPVVAVGAKFGNPHNSGFPQDVYEVPDLINNGYDGFWSDDVGQLVSYLRSLLDNPGSAKMIGNAGRVRATEIFGKEVIKAAWRKFL